MEGRSFNGSGEARSECRISIRAKKRYKGFTLDVRMSDASKRIGILGASGCGKSMILKMIAGVLTPDEGRIEINRNVLFDTKQRIDLTPQARRVGYLFQNYTLFPSMNVAENIAVGVQGHRSKRKGIVQEAIERFRLKGLEDRYPSQLSGGQQQRVALARIMVYSPDVLLLDEPFSAMDAHLKFSLQEELREMTSEYDGIMIMVSHSRDEIYSFADRIWIMDEGKIVCKDDTKEMFSSPPNIIAAMLTGCKNIFEIQHLDEHHAYVSDLDVIIQFERALPRDIRAIGYRAHDFVPVWGEREVNSIPLQIGSRMELPFETNYNIPTKNGKRVIWMVQREGSREIENRGYPSFLKMEEERILLLR